MLCHEWPFILNYTFYEAFSFQLPHRCYRVTKSLLSLAFLCSSASFWIKSIKRTKSSSENVQYRISEAFQSVWESSFSVSADTSPRHMLMWQLVARAQFNVLLFEESKCQSFPSADQTMNNCYFKENKRPALKWQRLNGFWFKVKYIMQFFFFYLFTPLFCQCLGIVLLWICFDPIMRPRAGRVLSGMWDTCLSQSPAFAQFVCS